ncbi:hypothetical protein Y598_6057 [Burkholderia pseudomallei MSHR3335]|nr:hypothetical protein Y598_6061 [Burkholderia pseudomallei MSHR3335]KGX44285.1 hypothetical protein Y598_6057 [Burkholderia pseudomallei MSHR3335]
MQSKTSIRSRPIASSRRLPSKRTGSGTTTSVRPDSNCTHCLTSESNAIDAFRLTRRALGCVR